MADARTLVHREALDCKYDFQTAILRVNKKLHNEALDTLYENHFVVVSCSWSVVGTGSVIGMFMQDYDVSAIAATKPKLVANFKVLAFPKLSSVRPPFTGLGLINP